MKNIIQIYGLTCQFLPWYVRFLFLWKEILVDKRFDTRCWSSSGTQRCSANVLVETNGPSSEHSRSWNISIEWMYRGKMWLIDAAKSCFQLHIQRHDLAYATEMRSWFYCMTLSWWPCHEIIYFTSYYITNGLIQWLWAEKQVWISSK